MCSSTSTTILCIKHSLASLFAQAGISILLVIDIRFMRSILLNRLLVHAEELRYIWTRIYCVLCAIRAFAATIAIILETSPPLLRVVIKNFWTILWRCPNYRGRPLGITANALFGSHFFLLHLYLLLMQFGRSFSGAFTEWFFFKFSYCSCATILGSVFSDTVLLLFSVGFSRFYSLNNWSVVYHSKTRIFLSSYILSVLYWRRT